MSTSAFSALALLPLLLLPASHAVPIAGCGMEGCEPGRSFLTTLPLPPGPAAPRLLWSLPFPPPPDCASTASPSPGCVSQGSLAACSVPLSCNSSGFARGLVGLTADGVGTYNYTGPGSGRCSSDASSTGVPSTLPIMDAFGDVVLWDNEGVSLLQSGDVEWTWPIDPQSYCGDILSSPSVSNTSRVLFYIGTRAEVFGYYADGVPVASVVLYANATPPTALEEGREDEAAPSREHHAPSSPSHPLSLSVPRADGLAVPIAPQVSDGIRFLYLCRFFTANVSGGGEEPRPLLVPTPQLILAAMDLHDDGIPRMGTPWQLPIPRGDGVVEGCVPPSAGIFPAREPLYVAGPLLLPTNIVVVALSCNASGVGAGRRAAAAGDSNADADAGGATTILGLAIDEPQPSFPAVTWTAHVSLGPGASAYSLFRDASPRAPAALWLAPLDGDVLTALDGATGHVLASVNVSGLVAGANASACPVQPGRGRVLLTGHPLAGADARTNGTQIVVAAVAGGTHWLLAVLLPAPGAGGEVGEEDGEVYSPALLWCLPTPGGGKEGIEGQLAVAQAAGKGKGEDGAGSGGSVVVFGTRSGVWGVGE
jgi:hypothetical protein